jgi:hypothetical protein
MSTGLKNSRYGQAQMLQKPEKSLDKFFKSRNLNIQVPNNIKWIID